MIQSKTIAILGGDPRQAHMANSLAAREDGYRIYGLMLAETVKRSKKVLTADYKMVLPQSDVVIFPLPLLDEAGRINALFSGETPALSQCLDYISPDAVVLAGKVSPEAHKLAKERDIEIIDYLQREEFSVLNAVPTAEGAVEIALRELSTTLFGSTCLITGYGRVAKVTAKLLAAFGAHVKVVARKYGDLAWIRVAGLKAVHLPQLQEHLSQADLVINTVPSLLLDEEKLARLKRSCLVIDLASAPGGVDFDAAKTLGLNTHWALSLPGKVAPVAAGEITLDTIFNILTERRAIP